MSLLKTCLLCLVAAVASASPPVVSRPRFGSGDRTDFSSSVNFDGNRSLKKQMKEFSPRVARMESAEDQQRKSLDNLKAVVKTNMDSLQTMTTNVSRRMDNLEAMFQSATSGEKIIDRTVDTKGQKLTNIKEMTKEEQTKATSGEKTRDQTEVTKDQKLARNIKEMTKEEQIKATSGENTTDQTVHPEDQKLAVNFNDMTQEEQIKACGKPPVKFGQKVKVKVNLIGKIKAKYSCEKQYVLVKPDGKKKSLCKDGVWSPISAFCNNLTTCGRKTSNRMQYNGTLSVTKSGKTCQEWTSTSPHRHKYFYGHQFVHTTGFPSGETPDQASNYCRDPGFFTSIGQVWCFTTDPKTRWEKCDVPVCDQGE